MSHFSIAVISEKLKDVARLLAPYQENNMGDCPKQYLTFHEDSDCDIDDETGKRGYWENPNRKWDYWEVGGRWSGILRTKYGAHVEQCRIKELDLSPNPKAYAHAIRFWEINVEGCPLREDEDASEFGSLYNPQYFITLYNDKEEFARQEAMFCTFAIVTPNGTWHEKGRMGWFGMSDGTRESIAKYEKLFTQFLESADPELFITVVDAHI